MDATCPPLHHARAHNTRQRRWALAVSPTPYASHRQRCSLPLVVHGYLELLYGSLWVPLFTIRLRTPGRPEPFSTPHGRTNQNAHLAETLRSASARWRRDRPANPSRRV